MSGYIECTQMLWEEAPLWPGKVGFSQCPLTNIEEHGYKTDLVTFTVGIGTHIDSPGHFFKGARLIHQLTLEELVSPAVVINVIEKCEKNNDYQLSIEDLLEYENVYGRIPKGALVCMRTGWGAKWNDPLAYLNANTGEPHPFTNIGTMHFPGFSSELAAFLTTERDIHGIGIDTLSLDPGNATEFKVHNTILGNNKYQIENMNLERMLPSGLTIVSLPPLIKDMGEMNTRVFAY